MPVTPTGYCPAAGTGRVNGLEQNLDFRPQLLPRLPFVLRQIRALRVADGLQVGVCEHLGQPVGGHCRDTG